MNEKITFKALIEVEAREGRPVNMMSIEHFLIERGIEYGRPAQSDGTWVLHFEIPEHL